MRIRLLLPATVAAAGVIALVCAGVIAVQAWQSHAAAQRSNAALSAFSTVLRAWEKQQLERRSLGLGLLRPHPDLAEAAADGAATDAAYDDAARALAILPGGAAQLDAIREGRRRLAEVRHTAQAELARPLAQRPALAASILLREFNAVQAAMAVPATFAESAAGQAEPAISQAVLIARLAAMLRDVLGQRSTLLTLYLSGRTLAPEQLVEATEYTGRASVLWERIGAALHTLGDPPALAASVAESGRTLMGEGERTYRAVLEHARADTQGVGGPPPMSFAAFRAFTEPMMLQPLALRDAALREARTIAAGCETSARRALVLSLLGVALTLTVLLASTMLVMRAFVHPMAQLAAEVGSLADGHLARPVAGAGRRDEIGDVARAAETLRLRSLEARRLGAELAGQRAHEAERLRQLADSTFEGILIHAGGLVVDANAALCGLIGVTVDALRGRDAASLFDLPAGSTPPWTQPASASGPLRGVMQLRAQDGSAVPVEALCRTIAYNDDMVQVVAVRDVRERLAAEQRIRHPRPS